MYLIIILELIYAQNQSLCNLNILNLLLNMNKKIRIIWKIIQVIIIINMKKI